MYCPRCGRQPIADELRFCSYCGFKLGIVKASLTDYEEAPSTILTEVQTSSGGPRQRDINIGVILMFVATLIATFMAARFGPKGRELGAAILAISYSLIVLLSGPITKGILKLLSWDKSPDANPSASRRGMGFGATLMFISTIVLAIGSLLTQGRMMTTPYLIGLISAFALLLVTCRYLLKGLQYVVREDSIVSSQPLGSPNSAADLSGVSNIPALQAAQEPISVVGLHRITTAEIVAPASITEHTTNLLENK